MKFLKLQPTDRKISTLSSEDTEKLRKITDQQDAYDILKNKLVRATHKLYALQTLFWDDMMTRHEQADTASLRGKALTVRVDENGDLAIVEIPRKTIEEELMGDEDDFDGFDQY